MQTTHIGLLVIAAIAACSGKNSTSNGEQGIELPATDENPQTPVVEEVAPKTQLSELVVNLRQRFSELVIVLKKNSELNERFDAINSYRELVRTTISTFDVSAEAAQKYMETIGEAPPSKLEGIRQNQKPRTVVHDDIDALHSLAVVSACGPECGERVLEFVEASFQQQIAESLSSQEEEMVKAWAYCEGLELGDAEGELYVPIGGENEKLFSSHLTNLVALQQGGEQEIQSLANTLEKECWRAWLSLCLDDCREIASTFPALSKAFPHMSKTLRTFRKKTGKRRLPHSDLKQLLGLGSTP